MGKTVRPLTNGEAAFLCDLCERVSVLSVRNALQSLILKET